MKLREGIELAYPPATHVHVPGQPGVVRIDALTVEEARDVIIRICDDLESYRHDLQKMREELGRRHG